MKGKTKKKLLKNLLSTLLCAVFLFTIGVTYSSTTYDMIIGSDPADTTVYASTQEVVVVNDTLENPITFAGEETNHKVSVSYSVGYDFDLRVTYSLSWSNGKSTDNVILNYANRDNFIVDGSYVYVAKSISAGTGTITIFTGADFIDTTDTTYAGATLTITASVDIYKTNTATYDTSHPLADPSSQASTAWLVYRNTSSSTSSSCVDNSYNLASSSYSNFTSAGNGTWKTGDAYIMVYNLRCDTSHGVTYPGVVGAYTSTGTWLGGNKFYSGIGVYVITGNSSLTITARASASWSGSTSGTSYEDNVMYNYSSGWTSNSDWSKENAIFDSYNYSYTIPAYSAVYIPITDSVEISLAGKTGSSDYTGASLVSLIEINGVSFKSSKIISAVISDAGVSTTSGTYLASDCSVINTTLFEAGLYSLSSSSQQTFDGEVSITNNTGSDQQVTLTYTLYYFISNGNTSLYNSSDNYSHASSLNSTYWYRATLTGSYLVTTNLVTTASIPAYSTVTVLNSYSVTSSLASDVSTDYSTYKNNDCWVVLNVSVTNLSTAITGEETASSTTNNNTGITVISSVKGTSLTISVKNNTIYTLTGVTVTLSSITENVYNYTNLTTQPTYWSIYYWQYYYSSDGKTFSTNTGTYDADTTYMRVSTTPAASLSSANTYNGATYNSSAGTITTAITLEPNETAVLLTATLSQTASGTTTVSAGTYNISASAVASTSSSTNPASTISIVNEGSRSTGSTEYAYIINNSSSDYYVRFVYAGAVAKDGFYSSGSYVYYIGIVHAGEIVVLPSLTSTTQLTINAVAVSGDYVASSTLSAWEAVAVALFDSYFSYLSS